MAAGRNSRSSFMAMPAPERADCGALHEMVHNRTPSIRRLKAAGGELAVIHWSRDAKAAPEMRKLPTRDLRRLVLQQSVLERAVARRIWQLNSRVLGIFCASPAGVGGFCRKADTWHDNCSVTGHENYYVPFLECGIAECRPYGPNSNGAKSVASRRSEGR